MISRRDGVAEKGQRSLADKLNHLFETVRGPGQKPYSNHQVADAINKRSAVHGGPTIDHSYIARLRSGGRGKPSFEVIEALAGFFGVKVDYFSDEDVTQRIDAQLALVAALRDSGVQDIALRAAGLSAQGLSTITAIIDQVRKLEGLPADGESTEPS
jgi:transcriptional regulator with XRE-family HTH domain